MQGTYVLNDLFVEANFRKKGVGEALLKKAKTVAIANNSKGITLETEITNPAQKLYKRLDWKKIPKSIILLGKHLLIYKHT